MKLRLLLSTIAALLLSCGVVWAQPLMQIPNAGSTGTTIGKLAKPTGAPATAVIATTGDAITNILGVVHGWTGTSGTTGNALITQVGQDNCTFDGATTANDYVGNSASVGGDCTDLGATPPTGGYLGRVLATIGSAGSAVVAFNTLATAPLTASGVSAGSYTNTNLTVNSLGLITAASSGSGSAAFVSDVVTSNQSPTSANCNPTAADTLYIFTSSATITLPATSTLSTNCVYGIKASGTNTVVTVNINAADAIASGSAGVGTSELGGTSQIWTTDAAGHWYRYAETPACIIYTTSNSSIPITAGRLVTGRMMGVGGAGGNGGSGTTASQVDAGGGGGAPGQYLDIFVAGTDIANVLGTSVNFTLASPPAGGTGSGGAGATTLAGSGVTFTAYGGGNGGNGAHSGANGGAGPSLTQGGTTSASAEAGGCSSGSGVAAAFCWGFGQGGQGSSGTGAAGGSPNGNNGPYAAGAGASGGGVNTSDAASNGAAGAPGGFGTGAGSGGTTGSPAGANATAYNTGPYVPGSAGGSGASSVTGNGGNAGNSGWGAGGSGGGGCYSTSSCTAGTGAAGGAGWLELCQF